MRKLFKFKPQKPLGELVGPCWLQPPESYYRYEVEHGLYVTVIVKKSDGGILARFPRLWLPEAFEDALAYAHRGLINIEVRGFDPYFLNLYSIKEHHQCPAT